MATPEALIIGGGVAGLSAARDLCAAGARVLVLEGRNRLGGRVMTRHTAEGPVELGAEFVHGAVEEILNVARQAGLALRETDRSVSSRGGGGADPPSRGTAPEEVDAFAVMDSLLAHASAGGADESFQDLVGRAQIDERIKAQGLRFVEGYHAADPARISVQSLLRNTAADERPGADRQFRFVEGYDGLVTALVDGVDRARCEIRLNAVVTRISWRRNGVRVRTSDGEEIAARQAIVTVPLGVLKAGAIEFAPALADKQRALDVLEMGSAARVSLCFGGELWAAQESLSTRSFLLTSTGPFRAWWVSRPLPFPVITGWAGGRSARALGERNDEQRVEAAVDSLAAVLGMEQGRLRRWLHGGFSHDWLSDPFARGAYSYAAVGGASAGNALAEPVQDTLFFAGEATRSDGDNATVHGAIASGRRAARQARGG